MQRIIKSKTFLFATLFAMTLASTPLWAQPGTRGGHHGFGPGGHGGFGHGGPGHGPGIARALHALDLTEAQQEQVHSILEQEKTNGQEAREALRTARKALAETIHGDVVDEAAIRAAAADVATLEADQAVARAELFHALRQVLTPEQQEQLAQMKAERDERRSQRRQRRGDRRGGGEDQGE